MKAKGQIWGKDKEFNFRNIEFAYSIGNAQLMVEYTGLELRRDISKEMIEILEFSVFRWQFNAVDGIDQEDRSCEFINPDAVSVGIWAIWLITVYGSPTLFHRYLKCGNQMLNSEVQKKSQTNRKMYTSL